MNLTSGVRELFETALALAPDERTAYLVQHCSQPQRETVERMLQADVDACTRLLDRPLDHLLDQIGEARPLPPASALGNKVGPFTIIDKLGQGGSSIVFRASREQAGVTQTVALKLLSRGAYSIEEQRQFRRERSALAQLNHAGIARLIEGGITETGIPYIALELVEGVPITECVRTRQLDLRSRLQLFVAVCRAVEAAHRALIVHRDLKPSNVFVTREGDVKLLDFGIAKMLDADSEDNTHTQSTALTPAYAAPEQFNRGMITTATDVYALGVLLGEIITGNRREPGEDRTPSSRIGEDSALGLLPAPAAIMRRQLRGDLDNIVMKATAHEAERRYASAGAFADDIERYLSGRPVVAHPPSSWYMARKLVTRHKAGAITGAVFLLAMFAALGIALWQANVAQRQAQIALEQAQRADSVQSFLVDVFKTNSSNQDDPIKARAMTARDLLEIGARKIDAAMTDAPETKLRLLLLLGDLHGDLGLNENAAALYRKAVDLAHAVHGQNALEAFDAQIKLANSLHSANSDEQAKTVLEQAQVTLDNNHDEDQRRRARLFDQFAQYYTQRSVPLALDYAGKSVALYDRLPASDDTAAALYRKARIEHQSNLDNDSITSYKRAIAVASAVETAPGPTILRYYAELAQEQYFHHQIAEGERNARKALQLATGVNGDNQIDVVECEMRLGRLLSDTGRLREGMDLVAGAKRRMLALRGPDDAFHTTQILFQNGSLLIRAGRIEAGMEDVEAAIANQRRNRPGTVPLAQFLEVAASAEIDLGQYELANRNLDESKAIREKAGQKLRSWSFDSNITPRIHLALARAQYQQAVDLLQQLSVSQNDPDQLDLDTINNALLKAEVAAETGLRTQAIADAQAVRNNIQGSALAAYYQPLVARANFIEGDAYLRNGDARAAVPFLELVLSEREKDLEPSSLLIAQTQIALANAYLIEGDVAKAHSLAQSAAVIHLGHKELGPIQRRSLQDLQAKLVLLPKASHR